MVAGVILILVASFVSWCYLQFAYLDHRYPDHSPSRWKTAGMAVALGVLSLGSGSALDSSPETATKMAMVVFGMLAAPAIAPPIFVDPEDYPSWIMRRIESGKGWLSGLAASKVVALIVVALSALFWPSGWYWIAFGICAFMLWMKGAALAQSASGESLPISPIALKKWSLRAAGACVCFGLIFVLGPYLVLSETEYVPPSWAGFAGFGIGSLFCSSGVE